MSTSTGTASRVNSAIASTGAGGKAGSAVPDPAPAGMPRTGEGASATYLWLLGLGALSFVIGLWARLIGSWGLFLTL